MSRLSLSLAFLKVSRVLPQAIVTKMAHDRCTDEQENFLQYSLDVLPPLDKLHVDGLEISPPHIPFSAIHNPKMQGGL